MTITAQSKAEVIGEYALNQGDTGSPEVQVALLTDRIKDLTEHFKIQHRHTSQKVLQHWQMLEQALQHWHWQMLEQALQH